MIRRPALAVLLLATTASPAYAAEEPPLPPPPSELAKAKPAIVLEAERTGKTRSGDFVLTRAKFRARVRVSPYVPKQYVRIKAKQGRRTIVNKVLLLRKDRNTGTATVSLRGSRRRGEIRVRASHAKTNELRALRARELDVMILRRSFHAGARGFDVRIFKRKLRGLGFPATKNSRIDGATGRAILAFRKTNSMERSRKATKAVVRKVLRSRGGFRVRFPHHGKHVEADLSRQVLALINANGKVYRTFHTSSGTPYTPTVRGHYRFYRKDLGTNQKGMVHSSYFIRGYAIHGYYTVPNYPASHGCLRVPIPNARFIFDWINLGDRIDVYI